MENFSFERICALLRYDWTLNKRKFQMSAIIIMALYMLMVFVLLVFNAEMTDVKSEANADLPKLLGDSCNSFFSFAQTCIWIVVTMLLTEKFCYPRTATNYLAIPGSTLEKFTVMALDYVIAFLSVGVMFFISFYVTLGIGYLLAPELEWGRSILGFYSPSAVLREMDTVPGWKEMQEHSPRLAHEMTAILKLGLMANFFATFANVALHGVICMFFKSNVQVKAILIELLMLVVVVIALVAIIVGYAVYVKSNHLPTEMVKDMCYDVMFWFRVCLFLQPLLAAAFCYIFYRQLRCKQAK